MIKSNTKLVEGLLGDKGKPVMIKSYTQLAGTYTLEEVLTRLKKGDFTLAQYQGIAKYFEEILKLLIL